MQALAPLTAVGFAAMVFLFFSLSLSLSLPLDH
jgi:hypothetical protein